MNLEHLKAHHMWLGPKKSLSLKSKSMHNVGLPSTSDYQNTLLKILFKRYNFAPGNVEPRRRKVEVYSTKWSKSL